MAIGSKELMPAELATLDEYERHTREMHSLLPFAGRIQQLQLTRRERRDLDPQAAAQALLAESC